MAKDWLVVAVAAPNLMIQQPELPALIRHSPCESLPHTNLTPPFTRIFKFVDFISDSREPLGIGTIFPTASATPAEERAKPEPRPFLPPTHGLKIRK